MYQISTNILEGSTLGSRVSFFILPLALCTVVVSLYLCSPLNPDQATFSYIGWRVHEGDYLYVDVTEINWPGAMWLHYLAVGLFGPTPWAWHAFDVLIMVAAVCCLQTLLPGVAPRWEVWALWLVYPSAYVASGWWFAGQRDIVASHFLIFASFGLVRSLHRRRVGYATLVAMGLVMAVFIRPTTIVFGPLLLVVAFLTQKQTGSTMYFIITVAGTTIATGVAISGFVLAWGLFTGGLRGFIEVMHYIAEVYSESSFSWDYLLNSGLYSQVFMVPTLVWAVVAWVERRREAGLEGLVFLALFVCGLISYFGMSKGFGYHLGILYPVIIILIAVGIALAFEALSERRNLLMVALCALGMCVFAAKSARDLLEEPLNEWVGPDLSGALGFTPDHDYSDLSHAEVQAIAKLVRTESLPTDAVFTASRLVLINYLTQRALPFPWASVLMVNNALSPFLYAEAWQRLAFEVVRLRQPRILVLHHADDGRVLFEAKPRDQTTPFHDWIENALGTSYREIGRWGAYRVWKTIADPPL